MKWIEIIELRSLGNGRDELKQELLRSVVGVDQRDGLKAIKLYCHASVDTDLSVHLYWETESKKIHGSVLALRLASDLEEFGRVNHSIWIEEETK